METADNSLVAIKNWNGVDTLKNIKNTETLIIWGDKEQILQFRTSPNFRK